MFVYGGIINHQDWRFMILPDLNYMQPLLPLLGERPRFGGDLSPIH